MTNNKKPEEAANKILWLKSPEGVFETYANQVHVNWSLDDIRLRFAQIRERDEDESGPGAKFVPVNMEKAVVTLSWRNAKVLRNLLNQIITNHEDANGEINLQAKLASNEGT